MAGFALATTCFQKYSMYWRKDGWLNSDNWFSFKEICAPRHKYFRCLYTIEFAIFFVSMQAKFHISSIIFTFKANLFDYVVHFQLRHIASSVRQMNINNITNDPSLPIMVVERWNLGRLMAESLVNRMVLVLWRYLKYLRRLSLEGYQLTKCHTQ